MYGLPLTFLCWRAVKTPTQVEDKPIYSGRGRGRGGNSVLLRCGHHHVTGCLYVKISPPLINSYIYDNSWTVLLLLHALVISVCLSVSLFALIHSSFICGVWYTLAMSVGFWWAAWLPVARQVALPQASSLYSCPPAVWEHVLYISTSTMVSK